MAGGTGQVNDPLDVAVVVYQGLCLFEFGIATELFGLERPELEVPWYRLRLAPVDPPPITSLAGMTVGVDGPDDPLEVIAAAGTVIVPGWRDLDQPPPGPVLDALREAHRRGGRLLSICSGAFLLAATGLLAGGAATTHWRYAQRLATRHPEIGVEPDILFVDRGSIITSAGSAAGVDAGLHLIRRDHGAAVANRVARRLVMPPQRDGGQRQFVERPVPTPAGGSPDDATWRRLEEWIAGQLDRPLTVAELASRAGMSPRSFARHFTARHGDSPVRWLNRQRVDRARELLETTGLPVEQVARSVGFASAASLRHQFGAACGVSPSRYRASFRRPDPGRR